MRNAARRILPVLTIGILISAGCRQEDEVSDVLARVGDDVITADEFRLNYEFGHGHLRRGNDPRKQYLDFMIYEKVMAREASRLGLDTAQAVVHAMRTLQEELLIERVFEEKVLSRIEVTEEEIIDEINKSAVSFQFRFIPALSEREARQAYEGVLVRGFDAVLEERLEAFKDFPIAIEEVTSPYVSAVDVDPAVLAVIQDLEIGTPSEPVNFGHEWYVFEVMDVRRQLLSEYDYKERAPTHQKVVYNRKAMEMGSQFVASTMESRNVVTQREGFEILAAALYEWYLFQTPARNLLHYIEEQRWETPFTRYLVDHYATPLVTFDDARWTIRTFLEHFTPGRYVIRADDPLGFKARLADVVALVVRDHVFLEMAERERLYDDPEYRRTLALWKNEWMYQQFRRQLLERTAIRPEDVQSYYERQNEARGGDLVDFAELSESGRVRIQARMVQEHVVQVARELAANYRIEVNEAMLDTLTLSQSTANPYMTVHLFKSNSNRQPFPIVDPNWITQ